MGPVFLIAYDSRIDKDRQLIAKSKFSNIVRGTKNSTSREPTLFLNQNVQTQTVSLKSVINTVAFAIQKSCDNSLNKFQNDRSCVFNAIVQYKFKQVALNVSDQHQKCSPVSLTNLNTSNTFDVMEKDDRA